MSVQHLTPYRKLELEVPDTLGVMADVARQLGSSTVSLIEEVDAIDQLVFTIRHGATFWIETIREGLNCKLTAGYAVDVLGQTTKRMMFEGIVTSYEPILPDNGKPELRVVCQNRLHELTKRKPGRVTYPSIPIPNYPYPYQRKFNITDKPLAISDIVRGVLEEHGIPIAQISIDKQHDYAFDITDPISQNEDETDYEFLQRLLTGKSSKTRRRPKGEKKTNHLVNARARMFMEVDPVQQVSKVHVVSEATLVLDGVRDAQQRSDQLWSFPPLPGGGVPLVPRGNVHFTYNVPGTQKADETEYNPLATDANLVIRGVQLRENREDATGKEIVHRQDVTNKAKGRRSVGQAVKSTDPVNKGAQRSDLLTKKSSDPPPSDFAWNYTLNHELVLRDRNAGILKIGDLSGAVTSGRVGWTEVKKYFIPRQVSHPPSARTIPKSVDIPRTATTPTGFTGDDKGTQVQDNRIKKYGTTLSCWTHGNIFVLCRKSYDIFFPFGRYTGAWFLTKIEHQWGNTYRMTLEFGR